MSSERQIRGWSYKKPLPQGAWGLLSTTMEFLFTMKELYRTLWWNHDVIPYIMAPPTMNFWNVEIGSLKGWTLLKVPIILKNVLDKSSLKLNFLQKKKTQWTHISISPSSGARGLQRLAFPFQYLTSKIANVCAEFLVENSIILINICLNHFLI